jgi:hypothetical protein
LKKRIPVPTSTPTALLIPTPDPMNRIKAYEKVINPPTAPGSGKLFSTRAKEFAALPK